MSYLVSLRLQTLHSGISAAKGTIPCFYFPNNPVRQPIWFPAGMPAQGAACADCRQCQVQPSSIFTFHTHAPLFLSGG